MNSEGTGWEDSQGVGKMDGLGSNVADKCIQGHRQWVSLSGAFL